MRNCKCFLIQAYLMQVTQVLRKLGMSLMVIVTYILGLFWEMI